MFCFSPPTWFTLWAYLVVFILCDIPTHAPDSTPSDLTGIFGEEVTLTCEVVSFCYSQTTWHKIKPNMQTYRGREVQFKNLTVDLLGMYQCSCISKVGLKEIIKIVVMRGLCQLLLSDSHIETVFNGSYPRNDNEAPHVIDVTEDDRLNVRCQKGGVLTNNCSSVAGYPSTVTMGWDHCVHTCTLPLGGDYEPCVTEVMTRVSHRTVTHIHSTSVSPEVTSPAVTLPGVTTPKATSTILKTTQPVPVTTVNNGNTIRTDKLSLTSSSVTSLILIWGTTFIIIFLLVATTLWRYYLICIKGVGNEKADVYQPKSFYGAPKVPGYYNQKYQALFQDGKETVSSPSTSTEEWQKPQMPSKFEIMMKEVEDVSEPSWSTDDWRRPTAPLMNEYEAMLRAERSVTKPPLDCSNSTTTSC